MGIIAKLKAVLGRDQDPGTPVAVEREPASAERAVKGLDDDVDGRQPGDGRDPSNSTTGEPGRPVEAVKGIGPAYGERLEAAGITTIGELAAADPDDLAEATGLGAGRVSEWVERAKTRID